MMFSIQLPKQLKDQLIDTHIILKQRVLFILELVKLIDMINRRSSESHKSDRRLQTNEENKEREREEREREGEGKKGKGQKRER